MNSFDEFKNWIYTIKPKWESQEIIFDKIIEINDNFRLMKFYIELHGYDSFGEIRFYESNGIYWIDLEAVARDFEHFYKCFEFDKYKLPNLSQTELEYFNFLNKR